MSRLVILEVEDINKRTLFNFHKHLLEWLRIKDFTVLVLLWTTNNIEKKEKYRGIIYNYFKDLGAKDILFLEENDQDWEEKFDRANIVYIPGGDTKILLEKLNENSKVVEKLREFDGLIIGNSAGAIALSKEGYGHKDGELIKYKGLSIVDLKILVHVKPEDLNKLEDKNVILLDEGDYIIITT